MTDVAASIGLAQLERYPSILARRRQLIERYDRAFAGLDVELLPHFRDIAYFQIFSNTTKDIMIPLVSLSRTN